jgi:hypothetical protein
MLNGMGVWTGVDLDKIIEVESQLVCALSSFFLIVFTLGWQLDQLLSQGEMTESHTATQYRIP